MSYLDAIAFPLQTNYPLELLLIQIISVIYLKQLHKQS